MHRHELATACHVPERSVARVSLVVSALLVCTGCPRSDNGSNKAPDNKPAAKPAVKPAAKPAVKPAVKQQPADATERHRLAMVEHQIAARGVTDPAVLRAMKRVPRHEFVPTGVRSQAYEDTPLPIGHEQTISQPLIVASMTELARVGSTSRVLEVGTGSGYQAAVLGEIAREVYTIEIVEPLASRATATLKRLGYRNVHVKHGDGYRGWPEHAPFDAIVVTAAPAKIPEPLKQQLAIGGRLVIPVGDKNQFLRVVLRTKTGFKDKTVFGVRFVPMTGEAQKK